MATFQFTREEYVAASLGLARKRTLRFILFVAIAIAVIATIQVIRANNLIAASPYAVALLIMVPTILFVSKHRLAKTYDDQSSLREVFTAEIGPEGVRYSHTNGTRMLHWPQVLKWSEDARFIYLFESDLYARILPKRALSADEDATLRGKLAGCRKA